MFAEAKITDPRTALICARLNLRGGKRRLQSGFSAAGVVALYDAVLFGMHYYITKHKRCTPFVKNVDPWDATSLFHALAHTGVFDDPLSFNRLSLIVERALWQGSFAFDAESTLAEVEKILMKLGVIPFHRSTLPDVSRLIH